MEIRYIPNIIFALLFGYALIGLLRCMLRPKQSKLRFTYTVGHAVPKEGSAMPLELKLTNEQKVLVTVNPVTEAGDPAQIESGSLDIMVQSGEAASVPHGSDPNSFWLVSSDNPGDTVFVVIADADVGSGVQQISDAVILHVEGAKAASLGLSAGEPVLK